MLAKSRCCENTLIVDDGYYICTNCGTVERPCLDTGRTAYNHTPKFTIVKPYSRKTRFFKKCLALLLCQVHCKLNEHLLEFLKAKPIKTPEDLFVYMGKYETKGRRPYDAIVFYWVALGFKQPRCTDLDIKHLRRDFDNICFAWDRLGFKRPRFPYSFLFRKIVDSGGEKYSPGMHELTKFVRKLCCPSRRRRYESIYKKCRRFDYKDMHPKLPDMMPKQIVTTEKIQHPKKLDVRGIPNVYTSQEEVDEAIRLKKFNVAKLFHMTKNGNLFVLSQDVDVRDVQLQNEKDIQLQQTLALNKLLNAQNAPGT